jgi:cytochrome P450
MNVHWSSRHLVILSPYHGNNDMFTATPTSTDTPAASTLAPQPHTFDPATAQFEAQLDLTPTARQKQGDIYSLTLAGQTFVVLNHPDYARHVISRPHQYPKTFHRNLPVVSDEGRLRQLRLLRPQFHRQQLAKLVQLMVATIDEGLQSWEQPDGPPLALEQALYRLTLNVLTRAMFGAGLPPADAGRITQAMLYLQEHAEAIESSHYLRRTPQLQAALAGYDAVFSAALAHTRQAITAGDEPASLLAMLLDAVDAATDAPLTDEQLRDEVLFIFFVGFENIGAALTWSLHLLMQHPDKLASLQAEVEAALQGAMPTVEHIGKLTYAGMVLQEALRLHPPAPWLRRTAVVDDVIAGHPVPAGATMVLPVQLYQYDPEFWPNPTAFEPERFRPEQVASALWARHPCAWLPFGAGPRFCLGRDFAMLEGKLILAMALQRFDFAPEGEGDEKGR